ncbi:hypothetical protein ACWEJ6_21250 [Nonomuraea sp. NPDC004702]
MKANLPCPTCGPVVQHEIDGDDAACLSCGVVHSVELDLLEGVVEVAFCPTCRQTMPVGHECDPTPCLRRTGLYPCGTCEACLSAQGADLARGAEYEHGSPSDIDHPA